MSTTYSTIFAALRSWGCDVDGALNRVLQDEDLLLECIAEVAEDENFAHLGSALAGGDVKDAFDAAHTLKGITANTGLMPLYYRIVEIVEPLRSGHADGLQPKYAALCNAREELCSILKQAPPQ